MHIYKGRITIQDILFDTVNYTLVLIFCITTIYPFLYIMALSLSPGDVPFTSIYIIPPKISLANYARVFMADFFLRAFYYTILRTILGTSLTLIAVLLGAYVLSKKYFPHRVFWTAFIVFTMFFSGGLIPYYFNVKNLGMIDTIWALVIPGLIPTFTMFIVRNYFMSLSESLEESARIDGANDIVILLAIIVPISLPIIATVVLWSAVGHWNAWFDSLIFTRDPKKHVLQVILRRIVIQGTIGDIEMGNRIDDPNLVSPENVKAATIMAATLPILLFYPFLQKYFVKGIMIGSLKG